MSKKRRVRATPQPVVRAPKPTGNGGRRRELLLGAGILGILLVVVLGAALGLSALSDGDGGLLSDPDPLAPTEEPGPIHVHGLGINPKDGTLFIATHTGMWRVEAEQRKAERVSDRLQDTMGFTVVGPDRFLGSGHPDPRDYRDGKLPPLLGLIESRDAGESWEPVSLLGKADFHVLRFTGTRVYGFDATNERLMVSGDNGRTWTEHRPPASVIDLVADPASSGHVIASTEKGLYESANAGRTWRQRSDVAGLLAWPVPGRLYIVGGNGRVGLSLDRGRQWKAVGDIGGQPAALLGRNSRELYVALHDGTIKRTTDSGLTWSVRSTPA